MTVEFDPLVLVGHLQRVCIVPYRLRIQRRPGRPTESYSQATYGLPLAFVHVPDLIDTDISPHLIAYLRRGIEVEDAFGPRGDISRSMAIAIRELGELQALDQPGIEFREDSGLLGESGLSHQLPGIVFRPIFSLISDTTGHSALRNDPPGNPADRVLRRVWQAVGLGVAGRTDWELRVDGNVRAKVEIKPDPVLSNDDIDEMLRLVGTGLVIWDGSAGNVRWNGNVRQGDQPPGRWRSIRPVLKQIYNQFAVQNNGAAVRYIVLTTYERSVLFKNNNNPTHTTPAIEVSAAVRRDGPLSLAAPCNNSFALILGVSVLPSWEYGIAPMAEPAARTRPSAANEQAGTGSAAGPGVTGSVGSSSSAAGASGQGVVGGGGRVGGADRGGAGAGHAKSAQVGGREADQDEAHILKTNSIATSGGAGGTASTPPRAPGQVSYRFTQARRVDSSPESVTSTKSSLFDVGRSHQTDDTPPSSAEMDVTHSASELGKTVVFLISTTRDDTYNQIPFFGPVPPSSGVRTMRGLAVPALVPPSSTTNTTHSGNHLGLTTRLGAGATWSTYATADPTLVCRITSLDWFELDNAPRQVGASQLDVRVSIAAELDVYAHLRRMGLEEHVVPKLHGLWGGCSSGRAGGGQHWMMLMSHQGQQVSPEQLSNEDKYALVRAYSRLHAAGVLHNDPSPHNWCWSSSSSSLEGGNGRPTIIDFGLARIRELHFRTRPPEDWTGACDNEMLEVLNLVGLSWGDQLEA